MVWVFFSRKATSKSFSSSEKMSQDASDDLKGMCHHEPCGSCSCQSPLQSPVPVTCSPGKLIEHPGTKGAAFRVSFGKCHGRAFL